MNQADCTGAGQPLPVARDEALRARGTAFRRSGRDGYRLRIGSYRVIFDQDATTILAIYVGRATTTYKRS
jgi:mRNA interferase RelE/StbE